MSKRVILASTLKNKIPNPRSKEIYHLIRHLGITSKFNLINLTNINTSTMTRILDELLSEGFIIIAGYGDSTGGRKPILYQANPTYAYVFGLDLSRTYTKLVLTNLDMKIIDSANWIMTKKMEPDYLLNEIVNTINIMLKKHDLRKSQILGMGIGTVGPLDPDSRIMLLPYDFPAPGWENVNICDFFEDKLAFSVIMDNGASTALRAEYWADAPHHYQNLVYIHLDSGFRSAIMSNNRFRSGAIGQTIIEPDGIAPRNPYGNYGALHSYVTINYIMDSIKSRLKQGRNSLLNEINHQIDDLQFSDVINAVNKNDPLAIEVVTQSATYLGIGLANLINILHPEKIILGGTLITNLALFYDTAIEIARKKTYYYPFYEVIFSKSNIENDVMAVGAGIMVIDAISDF